MPAETLADLLDDITASFTLSTAFLHTLTAACHDSITSGLTPTPHPTAPPMLPSHITRRATGHEHGIYLAIDLGGTNLRICRVHLHGDTRPSTFTLEQYSHALSEAVRTGDGRELFGYIADVVMEFLTSTDVVRDPTSPPPSGKSGLDGIELGFTFSFPVEQSRVDSGRLLQWTKGFSASGVVGKDVVGLLNDALRTHCQGLGVRVTAMVNDTVGTVLAAGYKDPNAMVGVIFGTGTNAAYYEKRAMITKLREGAKDEEEMIVNIEWGGLNPVDTNGVLMLPITRWDRRLDRESLFPGKQRFEKMVSGFYLGELVRVILLELSDRGLIFSTTKGVPGVSVLNRASGLDSAEISTCLKDDTDALEQVQAVLVQLGIPQSTLTDRRAVKQVCEVVRTRAARLGASALSAVLLRRRDVLDSDEGCTVGVDGSVYEHLPGFADEIRTALVEILGDERAGRVDIVLAKDGSGVGAALAAAVMSS